MVTPTGRRRILLGASVAAGLLLLTVAIGEAAGWPMLRAPLQSAMARAAGVAVGLEGPFDLRLLWRPRLQVGRLTVAGAPDVPVPHLLDASGVELAWRWRDLWRWRSGQNLRIERLSADSADVQLVRLADGRASWQLGATDRPVPPPTDGALTGLPRFGQLLLRKGQIVLADATQATQLQATVEGSEGDSLAGNGAAGYRANVVGTWQKLPLKLQIRSGGVLPWVQDAEADVASVLVPVRVEGNVGAAQLLFDGQAGALLGERRLQGGFRLRGPSLEPVGRSLGVTLPQTPPFDLVGQIGHTAGVWQLKAERATIGRSKLGGDFSFDTRISPPLLRGQLNGTRLMLADLGPAVGTPTVALAASAAKPTRVLPQRQLDLPSLRAMNADVQVNIDLLDLGSEAIAPLGQLKTQLLLDGGVLQLQALQAVVAGGRFKGSSRLDARSEPAQWALDLRFDKVDVAGWLRGLKPAAASATTGPPAKAAPAQSAALKQRRDQARQGGDQPVLSYLTGQLSGAVVTTGAGRSTAEILATLDGRAQLLLRDGTLSHLITEAAGLDLAQALGVLVRGDQPLPIRCARLDLDVKQGVAQPRLAVIDNEDSTLRITGKVDLRDESLALQVITHPKDFSPLTFRAPITVSGTLGAPVLGLNSEQLAAKVLGSVALGLLLSPLAAWLPLIDVGSRESGDPCAEKPQATQTPGPKVAAAAPSAPATGRAVRR